jgi:hypothetical protein
MGQEISSCLPAGLVRALNTQTPCVRIQFLSQERESKDWPAVSNYYSILYLHIQTRHIQGGILTVLWAMRGV